VIKIIKVRGASMAPTLASGDYLICTKARALRPGFVVVATHPKYGLIVKRINSIAEATIRLAGDNPESTSSDALGNIPLRHVTHHARWAVTAKGLKRL
jgi:nickel-type superoxide dismutase maturation protease